MGALNIHPHHRGIHTLVDPHYRSMVGGYGNLCCHRFVAGIHRDYGHKLATQDSPYCHKEPHICEVGPNVIHLRTSVKIMGLNGCTT